MTFIIPGLTHLLITQVEPIRADLGGAMRRLPDLIEHYEERPRPRHCLM